MGEFCVSFLVIVAQKNGRQRVQKTQTSDLIRVYLILRKALTREHGGTLTQNNAEIPPVC